MQPSCLNCGTALVSGRSRAGVFQECPGCNSRLAGFALIRSLLSPEAATGLWATARDAAPDSRACPLCRHGMSQTNLPGDPIVLDLCKRCHMVWFDTGEFEAEPFKEPRIDPVLKMGLEERRQYVAESFDFQKEMARDDALTPPKNAGQLALAIFGFPIEYDNPVSVRPFATWAIAVLITAASGLTLLDFDTAAQTFGFIPETTFRWFGLTLLTSFFIHGGIFHLVGNLYFLVVFGDNVEERLGPLRFLTLLACATIIGNLTSLLFDTEASRVVPHIGASGGISGLLSFYALQFPETSIGVLIFYRFLRLPAIFLLVLWILMQVIGAMVQSSGATMVDYGAHLGGAVIGFLFWLLWRKR